MRSPPAPTVDDSMRIAILTWKHTSHPQAGGAEVVADFIATGLLRRGHDVTLAAGGPATEHAYRSVRSGGDISQYLRLPWVFHHKIAPVDVVLDISNGIGFFSPLWQRSPVVGLVHHVHVDQWRDRFPRPVAALGRWLERSMAPRVYKNRPMIAVSRSTSDGLERLGYRQPITIEMGVCPVSTEPSPSSMPKFVVLGRLVPHKRVALALEMWEKVRPHTGGELVIVGDGPLRSELEEQAGEAVRFTGWIDAPNRDREISTAWLLIHPAHHEGWGTVVMEAASAGVPTVAFDVPGLRDSVINGRTGVLADSEEQFVQAWIELTKDDVRRSTLGSAALGRSESISWEGAVGAVEEVLMRAALR